MMKKFSLLVIILVCVVVMIGTTHAAITRAVNCQRVTIQTLINNAASGDTIIIPAGTCTWTTPAGTGWEQSAIYINDKSINLIGAGVDKTNIIDDTQGNTAYVSLIYAGLTGNKNLRISGFTFSDTGTVDFNGMIIISGTSTDTFRIDHNKFNNPTSRGMKIYTLPGVIDHNQFIKTSNGSFQAIWVGADYTTSWTVAMPVGTANNVFIEDNTFTYSYPNDGALDCQDGARVVFRYNTVSGTLVGNHGYDSASRSNMWMEVYNNTFSNSGDAIFPAAIQYRGGTGVIYDNITSGNWGMAVGLTNYRSCSYYKTRDNDWCDGNAVSRGSYTMEDGNTSSVATYRGWPCKDQIGRGTNQASYPIYIWGNTWGGTINYGPVNVYDGSSGTCYTSIHIKINRDYFDGKPMPGYKAYTYPHPLARPLPPKNLMVN